MLNLCQQTSTVILRTLYLTIAAAGHWSQHNVNYEQWSCVLCQQSVEVVCIFTFSWESALQCHDKQCIWHQRRPAHETPIPGGSACHWALCAVHMVMVMVMVMVMYTNDHNVTMSQCHNAQCTRWCTAMITYHHTVFTICKILHETALLCCVRVSLDSMKYTHTVSCHHRTHMPCHDGRAFGGETQRNKFLDKTHCRRISTEEIEQNLVSKLIFRKSIRSYKLLFKMFSENKKVVYFAQKIQILLVFDDLVCQ